MARITPLEEIPEPVCREAAQGAGQGAPEDRRCRGRPQVRPDDETRQIIYEAARHEFAGSGYAATSMETVARRAGVSTKTLYRLVPNKATLFEGMVSDRLDRFLADANLQAIDQTDIEQALYAALTACADLTLDEEVVGASAHGVAGGRQVFGYRRNVLQERHSAHPGSACGLAAGAAAAGTDRTR